MSHTSYLLQVTWRHDEHRIEAETLDRVDRSPRDQQFKHVSEIKLSGCDRRLTCCHVALFGAWIFVKRTMIAARVDRAIEAVQPTSPIRRPREARSASHHEDHGSIGFRSDGHVKRDLPLFVKIVGASDSNQTA